MGFLTTVKKTVLGADVSTEQASERGGSARADSAARAFRSADGGTSEVDVVTATGRSRADALVELVEARGGRVKQSELVEITDWSKATVSRHLTRLEDDGAIDRIPVGRCKVVLLPDETLFDDDFDPADADSSYPRT